MRLKVPNKTGYVVRSTKERDELLAEDVAKLMSLLKIARTQAGKHNLDDYVDASGYSAIAGEITETRNNLKSSTLGVSNDKKSTKTNNK